jgi:hypothetical protein
VTALAFPDCEVSVRVAELELLALPFEFWWKPGIVGIGNFPNDGTLWRLPNEPLIGLISIEFRVERDPYFRTVFADRRDKCFPRIFRDVLGLFDPNDIDTLIRFDASDIVLDAGE